MIKNNAYTFIELSFITIMIDNWVKPKAVEILLFLLNTSEEPSLTTIQQKVGGSFTTINAALDALSRAGLIKEERKPSNKVDSKRAVVIGVKRVVTLTPKGKKVAEKLAEIKEIMEKG